MINLILIYQRIESEFQGYTCTQVLNIIITLPTYTEVNCKLISWLLFVYLRPSIVVMLLVFCRLEPRAYLMQLPHWGGEDLCLIFVISLSYSMGISGRWTFHIWIEFHHGSRCTIEKKMVIEYLLVTEFRRETLGKKHFIQFGKQEVELSAHWKTIGF